MTVVGTELIDAVGSILDVDVTVTSTPSTDQVNVWLYDAAVKIMHIMPNDRLSAFLETETDTEVGASWDVAKDDVLKIVSVIKGGVVGTELPMASFQWLPRRAPYLFLDTFAYAKSNAAGGRLSLKFYPTTPADAELNYIAYPAAVNAWLVDTGHTFQFIPPSEWASYIVDYAVMMGKTQDEEPEQVQLMYQIWMQSVQFLAGGRVDSTKGAQ